MAKIDMENNKVALNWVTDSAVYDLHWKSIPMGVISGYEDWFDPYLGQGIYMLVVYTSDGKYVGFYVGESGDIGRRWREHLQNWFINPHDGYWIPVNADDFLADPVAVFNNEQLKKRLEDRAKTQARILDNTWFCFAEVNDLRPWHTLENVEYVVQEGLKKHIGIEVDGYIGDTGRGRPNGDLLVKNHFHMRRSFLANTLPHTILFKRPEMILIEDA